MFVSIQGELHKTHFGVKAYNINGDCMIITTRKWRNNGIVLLHVNEYKIVHVLVRSTGKHRVLYN